MKTILLILPMLIFCSCSKDNEAFFVGELSINNDVFMFKDCATGITITVADSADYKLAKSDYLKNRKNRNSLYCYFKGSVNRDDIYGEVKSIVINKYMGYNYTMNCPPLKISVGYTTDNGEYVMWISGNYTFVIMNKEQVIMSGDWYRITKDEGVLKPSQNAKPISFILNRGTPAGKNNLVISILINGKNYNFQPIRQN